MAGFPRDLVTELFLSGWTDITSDVRQTVPITITGGRQNENAKPQPSTCKFVLDDESGTYSPRNPESPLFGLVGRNTPVRHSLRLVRDTFTRTVVDGWGSTDSSTGTGHAWSLTGTAGTVNADFQVAAGVGDMSVPAAANFRRTYLSTVARRDVEVRATFRINKADILGAPVEPGNLILRGRQSPTVDYYMARVTIETNETVRISIHRASVGQLVAPVTVPGLVHTSSADRYRVAFGAEGETLRAKVWRDTDPEPYDWQITARDTALPSGYVGVRSGVASGNTNTFPVVFHHHGFEVRSVRYSGEFATLTPKWDVSHQDRTVAVEAAGILRRLTQGASPLHSSLRRGLTLGPRPPVSYWPAEDGRHASVISSAITGASDMTFTGGPPRFGANSDFPCSLPIPQLNNSVWTGVVAGYPNPNQKAQATFLLSIPDDGELAADNSILCRVRTTGTAAFWDVVYGHGFGGVLTVKVYDRTGVLIHENATDFDINGLPCRISFAMGQNGGNIDWRLFVAEIPTDLNETDASGATGTVTGRTLGVADRAIVNPSGLFKNTAIGHVALQNDWPASLIEHFIDVTNDLGAWVGERATDRFLRLCAQEGVPAAFIGTGGPAGISTKMGAQDAQTLVDLLTECAVADIGELYEPKSAVALVLRNRETFHNQTPAAQLDYANHQVAPPLDPTDDDQLTRNDILCKREDGSEFRAVLETGRLSVQPPPAGVGRYDTSVTVNVHSDTQLPDVAGWLLRLGTVDEARYPKVRVDLRAPDVGEPLGDAVLDIAIGDRLTITNLTEVDIFGDVSLIVRGYTEILTTAYAHSITFNCSPETPWQAIVLNDGLSRLDSDSSAVSPGIGPDDATMLVASDPGELWTTDPAETPIPITVGGEDMLATAITGTSSPQTFTVTRHVNGVHKPHTAGTPVRLTRDAALTF